MKQSIEIIIAPTGEITIDAVGFKGADCEKATRYLEEALGVAGKRVRKPESAEKNNALVFHSTKRVCAGAVSNCQRTVRKS